MISNYFEHELQDICDDNNYNYVNDIIDFRVQQDGATWHAARGTSDFWYPEKNTISRKEGFINESPEKNELSKYLYLIPL